MKVLRVISSMNPSHGGPCQGIRNVIPAMQRLGATNDVLCLDAPDAPYFRQDPFTIYALGDSKGPWAYNKHLLPWLEENMQNYDIVIVHGLWLYHGYAVYKTLRHKRRQKSAKVPKVFVMPHGMLDPYFQLSEGRKLKAIRNWLYWKIIEAKVVNEADGILFTCEEELKLARLPFSPYNPNRELNVGYGILKPKQFTSDMRQLLKQNFPQLLERPYLLFLSRVHEKKGVDILIEAYLKIKNQYVNPPRLVIAGPGVDSSFGKRLKATANGDNDIIFTGMLSGDLKWATFYGSDAFVLPSHQENFGIAVVEAMACGKAVLLSSKVNIWREIRQEGAGFIEDDNIYGVEKLLKSWYELSLQEKIDMGTRALDTYRRYFTVEEAAKRITKVLMTYAEK